MSRLQRITSDPAVCHGQPTVRGLRYPVESLLELLSSGMSPGVASLAALHAAG